MTVAKDIDGNEIKVGDSVGFKCDFEQVGLVIGIKRSGFGNVALILENTSGFGGGYIGGFTKTEELASDCWKLSCNFI
jgi:hypothetical protein